MNKDIITYGTLVLLLPVLQVSVFNNVDLLGYIDPAFYVIFIVVFPFYKNKTAILISSFALGLIIDIFTNDGGIHTFSLVFIAYIRSFMLQLISGKSENEISEMKRQDFPFVLLFIWISILTLIHHFVLFSLEQFSFVNFAKIVLKTLVASTFSIIVIIMGLQLFSRRSSHA